MDNEEFWIELSDCGEWGYSYVNITHSTIFEVYGEECA